MGAKSDQDIVSLPNGKASCDATTLIKSVVSYPDPMRTACIREVWAAVPEDERHKLTSAAHMQVGYGGSCDYRLFAWLCLAGRSHGIAADAVKDRIVAQQSARGILI